MLQSLQRSKRANLAELEKVGLTVKKPIKDMINIPQPSIKRVSLLVNLLVELSLDGVETEGAEIIVAIPRSNQEAVEKDAALSEVEAEESQEVVAEAVHSEEDLVTEVPKEERLTVE